MNWRLIFLLSLFGLAMAVATVFWIPTTAEPFCWLTIFLICAYFITKQCTSHYFLNGFMVCMFNCVWITIIHAWFLNDYIINHLDIALLMMNGNIPTFGGPQMFMAVIGFGMGIISGIILGSFSFIGGRFVKEKYNRHACKAM